MTEHHDPDVHGCSDSELVARYRAHGDTGTITELVRRHDRVLHHMAARMLRDREDAADAVQTAWIQAITALAAPGGFDERSEFTTWLWAIVRNEALNRLRRARVRRHISYRVTDDDHEPVACGDAFCAAEDRMLVDELLGVLPDAQRAAIELVWLRGLSTAEAAGVLGVARGTVKSRCARARTAMATVVARAGLITTSLDGDP